jgi:hypothetical protein
MQIRSEAATKTANKALAASAHPARHNADLSRRVIRSSAHPITRKKMIG